MRDRLLSNMLKSVDFLCFHDKKGTEKDLKIHSC